MRRTAPSGYRHQTRYNTRLTTSARQREEPDTQRKTCTLTKEDRLRSQARLYGHVKSLRRQESKSHSSISSSSTLNYQGRRTTARSTSPTREQTIISQAIPENRQRSVALRLPVRERSEAPEEAMTAKTKPRKSTRLPISGKIIHDMFTSDEDSSSPRRNRILVTPFKNLVEQQPVPDIAEQPQTQPPNPLTRTVQRSGEKSMPVSKPIFAAQKVM